jgi:hypothetical protein
MNLQRRRRPRLKVAALEFFARDHHGHDDGADGACFPPAIQLVNLRQEPAFHRKLLTLQLAVAELVREVVLLAPLIFESVAVQAQNKRAAVAPAGCPQVDLPPIFYAFSTYLASIYACRACNTTTWVGAIPTQDPAFTKKGSQSSNRKAWYRAATERK